MEVVSGFFSGNRTLPLVITRENKYPMGVLLYLIATALYLTTNHFHMLPPQQLPRHWIDYAVPFMPNTVWIYMSEWVYFAAVYICCRDILNLNKYFYSFLSLQFVSCLIFWLWPTTYPREFFPLPNDLNALTHFAFSTLRQTDTAANCCPSLHVSSVYLSAFMIRDERESVRGWFPFFFVWGTAISISTLTAKQHYLIDVVVGFLFAIVFYALFHRFFGYRAALTEARGAQANR